MNAYNDDDDEYIADYIDLVMFAIVSNIERVKVFRQNPTNALQQVIHAQSNSITRAENCLNVHIQRLIRKFKSDVNYEGIMSDVPFFDIPNIQTPDAEVPTIPSDIASAHVCIDDQLGMSDLDVDSIANDHIQSIFFLDDADDAEIAAYIDVIIAAIHTNMQRHLIYLRNPSPQLKHTIIEHSQSIARRLPPRLVRMYTSKGSSRTLRQMSIMMLSYLMPTLLTLLLTVRQNLSTDTQQTFNMKPRKLELKSCTNARTR